MKVVFVVGSTASGKSKIGFELAQKLNGAIVNCDSIQLYKHLDVGSAKPTSSELREISHYLYDYVTPPDLMTAGRFERDFFECLRKIESKYEYIFVVGGTGFYFQALEKGMYEIGAADEATKTQVEEELKYPEGPLKLFEELKIKDPRSAEKISLNDHYRLGRAIEVIRFHKKPMSEVKESMQVRPFPYPLFKLGVQIPKDILAQRVSERTRQMLANGLIEEVRSLIDQGFETWAPLESVGYREVVDFLNGQIENQKELAAKIDQSTMRLAKKQRTWFRRDKDIHWVESHSPTENILNLLR